MTSHTAAKRFAIALVGLGLLAFPGSAFAGRIILTGHDADHHCGRVGNGVAQKECHFLQVALQYVRGGAPDPNKPVLVLDRGPLDVVTSLDRIYGQNVIPRTVVDPRSKKFRKLPITTDRYSAVLIASSGGDPGDVTPQDLNERNSTPDSNAINKRAGALRAFFNAGGGIYAMAGNVHGDGAGDPYYNFAPVTVRPATTTPPYALTDLGRQLGFVDQDVTCCPTHNTFGPPEPSSVLQPLDIDSAGRVVSLAGETTTFAALGEIPVTSAIVAEVGGSLPSTRRCVANNRLRLKLRGASKLRFRSVTVSVNGRLLRRVTGKRTTKRFNVNVAAVGGRRLKARIVVLTRGDQQFTIRRTYRRC